MNLETAEKIHWGIWPTRQSFIISIIVMAVLLGFFSTWFELLVVESVDLSQSFYHVLQVKIVEFFLKLCPLLFPFYLLLDRIRTWPVWKRVLLFVALSLGSTVFEELVSYSIPMLNLHQFDPGHSLFFVLLSFDMIGDVLLFLFILSTLGYVDFLLCRNHLLAIRLSEEKTKLMEEERLRLLSELKALQAQINPHFLFNTLNSLAALVVTNSEKAEILIKDLSDWYRDVLGATHQASWTIRDEIQLVRNYLRIESVRLGERLSYDIQCSEETREIEIPPLTLQPVVENSVKHSIAPSLSGGTISIGIKGTQEKFCLRVTDARKAEDFSSENQHTMGTGSGLDNVKRRLELAFGGHALFNFHLKKDGAVVEIVIDRRTSHGK
ncbi:MAG: sensor histidine kinase [Nitrospiria bacterium]